MNIACIGGGPAGLYLGILVKLASPDHRVAVYERNRVDDTFGFGVVFSDATLGNLEAADPVSFAAIRGGFARWDDIEIHVGGEVLRSTGHGFVGIERKQLLLILQDRARQLGVEVHHEREVTLADVADADVVVACDGVGSPIRGQLAAAFGPSVDLRPNKFVWLGTTVPYEAFTFLFKQTPHGLFRVHAYRYSEAGSTFIVECTADTWRRAGFVGPEGEREDRTIALLEALFADELAGHRLIKNRSIWRSFPTVRNRSWRAGNVVLVGDAAHTAHFSIGSGTKLAMEDCIALRDALVAEPDVATALEAYERRRRPEVEALQAAAQASLEWFEGSERYLGMSPAQFTYNLMTRSLRVSHASVTRRDPPLARAVEVELACAAGVTGAPPAPRLLPTVLAGLPLVGRLAVAPPPTRAAAGGLPGDADDAALRAAAEAGAALLCTAPLSVGPGGALDGPRLEADAQVEAWRGIVEALRARAPVQIAARVAAHGEWPDAELAAAAGRAAVAGFDLLVVDLDAPGLSAAVRGDARAALVRGAVAAARAAWPAARPLAVRIGDGEPDRDATVALVAAAASAGAAVAWVGPAPATTLADRVRNELRLPTVVDASSAAAADLDAVIAAGRADVCALAAAPEPGLARASGGAS